MHIVQRVPRQAHRRMYLASERGVVNGVGLGEVDGLFNVGKMFTRMFTFTPSSFKFKNIAGAIGSAAMFTASGGLSSLAPKATGAHSKLSKGVGYGVIAGAAVTGAYFGGSALLSSAGTATSTAGSAAGAAATSGSGVLAASTGAGTSFFALPSVVSTGSTLMTAGSGVLAPVVSTGAGFLATAGSVLSTVGSGLMTVMKALPFLGQVMGGSGGGQQQQQGGMTQAEYDAMQAQAQQQAQQQAAYDAQVRAQQAQMYMPQTYQTGGMPISYVPETGQPSMTGMNASYGDLRTPYTAITEDGQQVQVNPQTGQIVSEGMSMPMMIGIGGIVALGGWYLMSGSKTEN